MNTEILEFKKNKTGNLEAGSLYEMNKQLRLLNEKKGI